MNDDILTTEELYLLIDDKKLIKKYNLLEMNTTLEVRNKVCGRCNIDFLENIEKFFGYKSTECKKCIKIIKKRKK